MCPRRRASGAARTPLEELVTDSDGGRRGWLLPVLGAAAVAAVGFVAHPGARRRARRAATLVTQVARGQLEGSAELAREGMRQFGRMLALPADRALQLAREHVVTGLPEAADTKWRVASFSFRATVSSALAAEPEIARALLDEAGRAYAQASAPQAGWDALTLREATRRLLHSLEMTGTEQRRSGTVEVVTTECALLEATPAERRPALCEAVCGEQASLLHGLAAAAGARIESPLRMGVGDPHCVRRLTPGG
jgi:hypothetical protein